MGKKERLKAIALLNKYWRDDSLSGLMVFVLALPLSMGIAQASDFQPIYGLITAAIGGLVVTFFSGSEMTIKGPAAGLIVVVGSAVSDFGGGVAGWQFALGAIVCAGIVQMAFGWFKLGRFVHLFPAPTIHGMLAAIGLIIMSKQLHGLLGHNPTKSWIKEGLPLEIGQQPILKPFQLFQALPQSIAHADIQALAVSFVTLVILISWPLLRKKVVQYFPGPLVALVVAILVAHVIHLNDRYFVFFDQSLADTFRIHVSFRGVQEHWIFAQYVAMIALIGSLEALLTVKAIDSMDPLKRHSNPNKELVAVGLGNVVSGIFGGLPMISEVARSSANVYNGGKTRWANFFHGAFMLLFLVFALAFNHLIPKPALAALLVVVGFRLAHPSQLFHAWREGKTEFLTFSVTLIAVLATDLLLGIFIGMMVHWGLKSAASKSIALAIKQEH
jgi:MFS superfamily sulfate permease-like transporter